MLKLSGTILPVALWLTCISGLGCGSNTDSVDWSCSGPDCNGTDPCAGVICDSPGPCQTGTGQCVEGECVYSPMSGGVCDDGDPCTKTDTCQSGACVGKPVQCDAPPGSACVDAATLEVYSSPGTCKSGTCVYSSQKTTCSMGCEAGACEGDPCAGVACNTPPGQCYGSTGTCNNGVCSYQVVKDKSCDDGDPCTLEDSCSDSGACAGTPLDCQSPPATTCASGSMLTVYDATGTCDSAGKCVYASKEVECTDGCSNGSCQGNPCAGVVCDSPPDICHQAAGTCQNGVCSYEFDNGANCDDGDACTELDACQSGVCAGKARTCNTPPAPACVDAQTLRAYGTPGQCDAGDCGYPPADVKCSFGCKDGACLGDPCGGVVCDTPDTPECLSATVLQTSAATGTCSGGVCSYTASTNNCTYGCASGACQPPSGIVISELLFDSTGSPDTESFLELHGPAGLPLDGLSVVGVNGNGGNDYSTFTLTGNIGADGLFVVAHPSATGTIAKAADMKDSHVDFQNGPDSVQLRFGSTVLDAVAYGTFTAADIAAGEGTPAVKPAVGMSLHRDASFTDTNNNAADFTSGTPTPGAANIDTGCDTVLNPGCDCINGSTQSCGTDVGACELGSQTCASGKWSSCTGGVTPIAEVCGNQVDDDCDSVVDNGCGPVDVFAPGACAGTGMTAAEAAALLGSQTRKVLSSATIQVRQRSCGTCAWGTPTDWIIHYLTYSGGMVTRYKDLPASMNLVLFKDGGIPKFSIQHTTFVGSTYTDADGMVYGFPPSVISYPHVRAYNFAPASQYDYVELDYQVKDGTVVIGDHCLQWLADTYGNGGPPYTTGYGVVFKWN